MESFKWSKDFLTGLPEIDRQHHHLVDVINKFGSLVVKNEIDSEGLEAVFQELNDYTHYHFKEEEEMTLDIGVDDRHRKEHCDHHRHFLQEITSMKIYIAHKNSDAARSLFKFLIYWLAYHILKIDQSMARQITEIQAGLSSEEAYLSENKKRDSSTEPLLVALNGLFQEVSKRNMALLKLNESLEIKVAERTKELSEANRRLENLSLTDVLTELPNRRYAMIQLKNLWDKSSKTGVPIACMMVDADGFKHINDSYGHDAGDIVLKRLAQELCHAVRNDDTVCRLGGDEFLIICPDTHQEGARHIAEMTCKAIDKLRVPAGKGEWRGSVSIGVAVRTPDMSTMDSLIKAADDGVYAAKKAGKNCVRSIQSV